MKEGEHDQPADEEPEEGKGEAEQGEEEGDDQDSFSEYDEEKEPLFHTTKEIYRLVQVVLELVSDLRSHIAKLDKANDSLAMEVK